MSNQLKNQLDNLDSNQFKSQLTQSLNSTLNLNADQLKPQERAMLAEVFCTLSFKPDSPSLSEDEKAAEQAAEDAQGEVGTALAACYDNGCDGELGIPRDPWKAKKYGRRSDGPTAKYKRTEYVYGRLLWYTRIRLFLTRLNRIFSFVDANYAYLADRVVSTGSEFFNKTVNAITANLSKITAYAGLSYFVELFFDFSIMLRAAFKPTAAEKQLTPSAWRRFVNTFHKDDRAPRMANAAFWGGVNLACILILSPMVVAALNLGLFIFDVVVDVYKYYRDKNKHVRLHEKLDQLIAAEQAQNSPNLANVAKYQRIKARLLESQEASRQKRRRALIITSVILVGMVMLLVPQIIPVVFLSLFAVKMIGAAIAFSGSVFGGFGKAVYDKVRAPKPKKVDDSTRQMMDKLGVQPDKRPPPPSASSAANSAFSSVASGNNSLFSTHLANNNHNNNNDLQTAPKMTI